MFYLRNLFLPFLFLGFTLLNGEFVTAQEESSENSAAELQSWTGLEAFMDEVVSKTMTDQALPGLVVTIVQGHEIIFLKGYGFSDVETKTPVDADATLFRVGSVAKPVTANAILQLVAQGQVDLDADISEYLGGLEIERSFAAPVTLRSLLTHTSGFDNTEVGDASPSAQGVKSLPDHLSENMPAQGSFPEKFVRYSNYNLALVGYIVELMSGQTFDDYTAEHLFEPLGMDSSTFNPVLDEAALKNLSKSYTIENGEYIPLTLDYSLIPPADGLFSTGRDMGLWLSLQLGTHEQTEEILPPYYAREMQTQQYPTWEDPYGIGLTWFENFRSGNRILTHPGSQLGFSSLVALVPDKKIGFFISVNRRGDNPPQDIMRAFLDEYVLDPGKPFDEVIAQSSGNTQRFAGEFQSVGGSIESWERIDYALGLRGGGSTVSVLGDGVLDIDGNTFVEISEGMFRYQSGHPWTKTFIYDEDTSRMSLISGTVGMERTRWFEGPIIIQAVLAFFTILSLLVVLGTLVRKIRKKNATLSGLPATVGKLRVLSSSLFLIGIILIVLVGQMVLAGAIELDFGEPFYIPLAIGIFTLFALISILHGGLGLFLLLKPGQTVVQKIWTVVFSVLGLATVFYLFYLRLLFFI